jgi:hypothetical protein
VRQASEARFAYEQRVFRARSEIRETAARTLEIIAQTQVLMAQLDAVAATMGAMPCSWHAAIQAEAPVNCPNFSEPALTYTHPLLVEVHS